MLICALVMAIVGRMSMPARICSANTSPTRWPQGSSDTIFFGSAHCGHGPDQRRPARCRSGRAGGRAPAPASRRPARGRSHRSRCRSRSHCGGAARPGWPRPGRARPALAAPQRSGTAPLPAPPGWEVSRMCRGIMCSMVYSQKHPRSLREYASSIRPASRAGLPRNEVNAARRFRVSYRGDAADTSCVVVSRAGCSRMTAMAEALAATAARLDPRKFRDPLRDRRRRAAGAGRAQIARHALVQHRHAVQPDLPALLHRIVAAATTGWSI